MCQFGEFCIFTFVQVYVSEHYTCPFGASGSVYAWERVARGIQAIANNLLGIPVLVYVDDYFAIDWYIAPISKLCHIRFCIACSRPDCMEHSMLCFARLVRAILGQDAVSKDKLQFGMELPLLGVQVQLTQKGYTCRPVLEKKLKIAILMKETLKRGFLNPGLAQKLAGNTCACRCVHFCFVSFM